MKLVIVILLYLICISVVGEVNFGVAINNRQEACLSKIEWNGLNLNVQIYGDFSKEGYWVHEGAFDAAKNEATILWLKEDLKTLEVKTYCSLDNSRKIEPNCIKRKWVSASIPVSNVHVIHGDIVCIGADPITHNKTVNKLIGINTTETKCILPTRDFIGASTYSPIDNRLYLSSFNSQFTSSKFYEIETHGFKLLKKYTFEPNFQQYAIYLVPSMKNKTIYSYFYNMEKSEVQLWTLNIHSQKFDNVQIYKEFDGVKLAMETDSGDLFSIMSSERDFYTVLTKPNGQYQSKLFNSSIIPNLMWPANPQDLIMEDYINFQ